MSGQKQEPPTRMDAETDLGYCRALLGAMPNETTYAALVRTLQVCRKTAGDMESALTQYASSINWTATQVERVRDLWVGGSDGRDLARLALGWPAGVEIESGDSSPEQDDRDNYSFAGDL